MEMFVLSTIIAETPDNTFQSCAFSLRTPLSRVSATRDDRMRRVNSIFLRAPHDSPITPVEE
jgi:hypothetical protein